MPVPPEQKTQVVELTAGPMDLMTDLTSNFTYVDVDAEIEGEKVESVRVLTATWNRASQHSWAVFALWQNKSRSWSSPVQLTADLRYLSTRAWEGTRAS